LELQVIELPMELCKWLVDKFNLYSLTLYISSDKKIEITPMDMLLTLALPIGRRLKNFMRATQKPLTRR